MANTKSGQVVLVVLLLSAIIVTIGLAMASQTITDVAISTQEQENLRAFSAAEAGVEELLGRDDGLVAVSNLVGDSCTIDTPCEPSELPDSGDIDYLFALQEVGNSSDGFEIIDPVLNGDVFQLNLDTYSGDELTVYWTGTTAAIELVFLYDEGGTIRLYRQVIADNGVGCMSGYDHEVPTETDPVVGGFERQYSYSYLVDDAGVISSDLHYMRVRPLCTSESYLAFLPKAGSSFPTQMYVAHVESQSGENVAAVETQQSAHQYLPGIFDFALYSGGSINVSD